MNVRVKIYSSLISKYASRESNDHPDTILLGLMYYSVVFSRLPVLAFVFPFQQEYQWSV